jgi:hypothetical protein
MVRDPAGSRARPGQPLLSLLFFLRRPTPAQLPLPCVAQRSQQRPSRHPSTVRPTDSSPRIAGPARPSLQLSSHSPGEAQWPASDEPSSSSLWRPRRRTMAARPSMKKSLPNRIKTEPHSNPTMLRDRVSITHVKDPKSPINGTPSRQILAQNRAQTLEASVMPSPRRCKPSPIGPVPRQPSTTSTAPHLIGPR